jgi:hypothetical protein
MAAVLDPQPSHRVRGEVAYVYCRPQSGRSGDRAGEVGVVTTGRFDGIARMPETGEANAAFRDRRPRLRIRRSCPALSVNNRWWWGVNLIVIGRD